MRYEEYLEKLKNAMEKKLGCPIEIKEIKKNNGYTYRGLVLYALKDFLIKRLGSLLEHTT